MKNSWQAKDKKQARQGMKRAIYVLVALLLLVFTITVPMYAYAHAYVRGGIWIGPGW